jgi:hypothetical protein
VTPEERLALAELEPDDVGGLRGDVRYKRFSKQLLTQLKV